MHVDVNEVLQQEEGTRVDFSIDGEQPVLEDVALTQPLSGKITVMRTASGVTVHGRLQAHITLQCHRCLRDFEHSLEFPLEADFSERPTEEEFTIARDGKIDLDEPVRQDIITHLPARQLCQEDCKGITIEST